MYRNVLSNAPGFLYGGAQFCFAVLVWSREFAILQRILARFVHLDEVCSELELFTDDAGDLLDIVRVGGVGEHVLFGVETIGVFMAAENVYSIPRDPQAGARDQALVNRVPYSGIGRTRSFGAHVAFRGEAGHQVVARSEGGDNRALWNGFFHGLQIFSARVQKKVHMSIDQSGHESKTAEIDPLRTGRMSDGCTRFRDARSFHQNLAGTDEPSGSNIEQVRGMNHDLSVQPTEGNECGKKQFCRENFHQAAPAILKTGRWQSGYRQDFMLRLSKSI